MTANSILIVEDREDWRDILCEAVEAAGYKRQAVASYEEALAALQAQKFDLAIVDPVLDMSNRFNRDGLSVLQKIVETQPNVPVLVLTGSLTNDLKESLQHLKPGVPVMYKESWDRTTFGEYLQTLALNMALDPTLNHRLTDPAYAYVSQRLTPPEREQNLNAPRVLLVENREDWQNIVTGVLDELDCFWRVAVNAQQALHEMESETFHLVILDLKLQSNDLPLPSNEGWLLLEYLMESRPKTKIVVLSGKASPSDVASLLTKYPALSFVEKQQFSSQAIKDAIAEATRAPALRIQTFGPLRLWRDGQPITHWERPQAELLVKLLLVRRSRGEQVVAADEIINRLWPESDLDDGRKKLLPLISNARRTIEPDIEARDSNFIRRGANGYYFDLTGNVLWDLIHFRQYLSEGHKLLQAERWEEAISALEAGRQYYQADFLVEDRYTDWVTEMQREVSNEYRDLLIDLADAYTALEQYPQAISACEAALNKDPLVESVYRRLMRLHYCNGEKGQALKVYRDCIKLFEELFGEAPTPTTRQLKEAIANDESITCGPEVY